MQEQQVQRAAIASRAEVGYPRKRPLPDPQVEKAGLRFSDWQRSHLASLWQKVLETGPLELGHSPFRITGNSVDREVPHWRHCATKPSVKGCRGELLAAGEHRCGPWKSCGCGMSWNRHCRVLEKSPELQEPAQKARGNQRSKPLPPAISLQCPLLAKQNDRINFC